MEQLKRFKYMICDSEKRPTHSFDTPVSYDEAKDKPNVAILMEEPYVIIDIDNEKEFDIVCNIIKELDIKTRILKTTRGGHFWFRSLKPMKNVNRSNTPLTVKIDIKSWGSKTMEVVKMNGEWREWLQFDKNVDIVPTFLQPISCKKDVMGYKDGDGRDDALFTFIIPLINESLSKDEIRSAFYLINKHIFAEPLDDFEIDKMFDDNKIFESSASIFYKGVKFQHHIFADYLMREYKVKGYGNDVFFYYDGRYTNDKDILTLCMLNVIPGLNTSNIRETHENIRIKSLHNQENPDNNYINLKNGLLNIHNFSFIEHDPEIFTINQLNCYYDKEAFDEPTYNVIRALACEDEDIITLLIQMLGYTLLNNCRFQKAFILLGNGRNGKSMFLDMIRAWLGDDNCSSLALEDLSKNFLTAELVGKMVNIGDDSGHNLLENTAIFKKLVTGDSIVVQRKHQNPFKFVNKAKMIFAANTLPPTTDKSEGFFRRCIIIPFNAYYKETDKNYDPNMLDKITTSNAKSYLLLLAIEGLKSLIENNKFYIPNAAKTIGEYYELSNNNILMWYQNTEKSFGNVREAFTAYLLYCTANNYKPVSIGKFQIEYERLEKGLK